MAAEPSTADLRAEVLALAAEAGWPEIIVVDDSGITLTIEQGERPWRNLARVFAYVGTEARAALRAALLAGQEAKS